jgi:phosphopantetheinyl transferase
MHDRESFDRDLGLEILATRQKNHWHHFLKLFNHLESLEETKKTIEENEKKD